MSKKEKIIFNILIAIPLLLALVILIISIINKSSEYMNLVILLTCFGNLLNMIKVIKKSRINK